MSFIFNHLHISFWTQGRPAMQITNIRHLGGGNFYRLDFATITQCLLVIVRDDL